MVIDEKDRIIGSLRDEIRTLRNLATSGIISNQCIHETKLSVDNVGVDIATALAVLDGEDIDEAIKHLQDAKSHLKVLKSWFDVTIGSTRRDKREMKYINLSNLVTEHVKQWKRVLTQDIEITTKISPEIGNVKCFPYEIESILSNLITNSMYAFNPDTIKKIKIEIQSMPDGIIIKYQDTGRGLAVGYKKEPRKILDALETDKRNTLGEKIGTGMGMWIINNIVEDYNGEINLEENEFSQIGFHATIKMKMKKREV